MADEEEEQTAGVGPPVQEAEDLTEQLEPLIIVENTDENRNPNQRGGNSSDRRVVGWCFTWNNPPDDCEDFLKRLFYEPTEPRLKISFLCYGRENAGTTGTYHLQGFLQLEGDDETNGLKSLEDGGPATLFFPCHWSKVRSNTGSRRYCRKTGNFLEYGTFRRSTKAPSKNKQGKRGDLDVFLEACEGGEMTHRSARWEFPEVYAKYPRWVFEVMADSRPTRELEGHELYPWQVGLLDHLTNDTPCDREIIFVVDTVGDTGKSWFCRKMLTQQREHTQLMLPAAMSAMAFALEETTTLLLVDCPRQRQDCFQYDFLEHVKNGLVMSSKYESRMKQLGKCHVVVFMNHTPDKDKLSLDRLRIINVDNALKTNPSPDGVVDWKTLVAYCVSKEPVHRPGFVPYFHPR